ncbi:acetolactate synthase large subunit, partial [Enterobacter hormaechei]|nr:acetolactate synthase large subunit [Enterobacter hormaechei]
GMVRHQQSLFDTQGVFAATYPEMITLMQIAAGVGMPTSDLKAEEAAPAALQDDISRHSQALIRVRPAPAQKVWPKVAPAAANT